MKSYIAILLFISPVFTYGKSNFDVSYYDIDVRLNLSDSSISCSNTIHGAVTENTNSIFFDLIDAYQIDSVVSTHHGLKKVDRKNNKVEVFFKSAVTIEEQVAVSIYYTGKPPVSHKPPWEGGFIWSKDSLGYPLLGIVCQNEGASIWLPCKDELDNEPDSIQMTIHLNDTSLTGVSNGRLVDKIEKENENIFVWKVSYPINPYNITLNIGHYEQIQDVYFDDNGKALSLNYYMLPYHIEKARNHFTQVKKMLKIYENLYGPYPFWRDGYKLVESPYWGMEHQTAIAYGNDFSNNSFGFDFILIHESAHEYWGNSISCTEKSQFWIHEAYATYSEVLYVEDRYDYDSSVAYLKLIRSRIKNETSIANDQFGSTDMYYKGAWMLQTLRSVVNNDYLWFSCLKDLSSKYAYQNITDTELLNHITDYVGLKAIAVFEQYLNHATIPELHIKKKIKKRKTIFRISLHSDVDWLELPFLLEYENKQKRIVASKKEQKVKIKMKKDVLINTSESLVELKLEKR